MFHRLLVALLLLAFVSPVSAQSDFVRGDCNGDLVLNISDPVTLLAVLFNGGAVDCQSACDGNDDGGVDLSDAVYLLGAVFSGGTPPPAPYPGCGSDPTADALTCVTSSCPSPPGANLREVAVSYLGSNGSGDGLLVSATGSGAQHQLTSWNIASMAGQPTALVTTPPIDGHHPQIKQLSGLANLAGEPPFVTGAIRSDGNLWLTSRELNAAGNFFNFGTVGYGSNANVEVLSYAMETRSIYSGFFLTDHQIATAVVVEPTAGGSRTLRIVSWGIDAATGALNGQEDSGDLPVNFPQNMTPDEAAVSVSHLNGIQYVLNFTNSSGQLENHFFWVEDDGFIVYGGGDNGGRDIRDSFDVIVDQDASQVAAVTDSGFLTASRAPSGDLELSVWERRAEGFLNWEPFQLADDSLDLGPNAKGVFLASPNLTDSWIFETAASDLAGDAVAVGDFNGDGLDDAVIAVPRKNVGGTIDVGSVYVIHGSNSNGVFGEEYTQVWSQATPGVAGATEASDRFGEALAVGDFDGDGMDDLAVGLPFEDIGATSAGGAVNYFYGTPFGLSTTGNGIITQEDLGQTSAASDLFGYALTSGDYDDDGRDDLAIGAYGREVGGHTNAGVVYVVWGSASGLTTNGSSLIHQDTGIWDQAEDFDQFGQVLASGDFNGNGNDDLAIGVPREDIGGAANAGAVHVLYGNGGSGNGFSANNFISQAGFSGGSDIRGAVEANDLFGSALAAGDFNDDGAMDLAIGVPGESIGSISNSGAVNTVYGTIFGLTHINNLIISQDEFNPTGGSLPAFAEEDDDFGWALTAADFDGDGYVDLAVGAPGKGVPFTCDGSDTEDVGAFFEIFGGANGLTASGSTFHHQNYCSGGETADGVPNGGDRYGHALASGDFNADGEADLIVGIPFKDRRTGHENSGAVHLIEGTPSGLDYDGDEEWYIRVAEEVRAIVSDLTWEEQGGEGAGELWGQGGFLGHVHVASVTKVMTLLLTVEAIEAGLVSLSDDVDVSSLAGTTGGSFLEQWDNSGPVLDMNGNEIRFVQTGDTMPLRLLVHGMMMRSGNRCSVAIGQHVAQAVEGDPDEFVNMMSDRASALSMGDTICGHPAGGMISKPQDLINLLLEGWDHSLFRQIMGRELYGDIAPGIELCGTDIMGMDKCNSPFTKFQTIGSYPGRLGWKGGNGRLWWSSTLPYGSPVVEPDVSSCTSSAVAVVERGDRLFGMALQQTGDRAPDSQRLLDYGVRRVFTPDLCDELEFPTPGGIVGPEGPIRVRAFAVDSISDDACVTAVIDDYEELRLNVWGTDFGSGDIYPLSSASETYTLPGGATYAPTPLVRMARVPSAGASLGDYIIANLQGEHLDLQIWRVGETP